MKITKSILAVAMIIAVLPGLAVVVRAQDRAYRRSDREVEKIIHTLENHAKTFRSSLDHALDQSRIDGTSREDMVNVRIKAFEAATKQLHHHFDSHQSVASDVQNVLDRAARIDEFMRGRQLDQRTQRDWTNVRSDLDSLADAYSVGWRWQEVYPQTVGQMQPFRVNDRQVERVLHATEKDADKFRNDLDRALDRSRLDGTSQEDNINQFVKDFSNAAKDLRDRFDGHTSVAADVEAVLTRAARIDDFMMRHRLEQKAQRDWRKVRSDLDLLASAYNVRRNWANRPW